MTTADELRAGGANESLLLTPEEAARLLRIGRTTVYALMKAGDLRPVHIGRSCRLARAELERYVNRLLAPEPTERRRPQPRRRTNPDQRGLFEVDGEAVDESIPGGLRMSTRHRPGTHSTPADHRRRGEP
jgi:excisionase family DNA binding protein